MGLCSRRFGPAKRYLADKRRRRARLQSDFGNPHHAQDARPECPTLLTAEVETARAHLVERIDALPGASSKGKDK
jgi:hypothetical protein